MPFWFAAARIGHSRLDGTRGRGESSGSTPRHGDAEFCISADGEWTTETRRVTLLGAIVIYGVQNYDFLEQKVEEDFEQRGTP